MKEIPIDDAWKRKYPERTVLVVSCDSGGKANMITVGWNMPASSVPPTVAISVGLGSYSHRLISESGEFVICFPGIEMLDEVIYCGTHSGRDVDKFVETGLTPVRARHVRPPLIEEAVVNMECKVVGQHRTGDHTIFVGEILAAYISDEERRVLFNLGQDGYEGYPW